MFSLILAVALCVGALSPGVSAAPAQQKQERAPTWQEAAAWACAQDGAYYDLDGKYGAQCADLVTAYMNWLTSRDPRSRRYGVYYAYYYPTVAGWEPDLWEVIPNTPELIPQPGDIFVSKGGAYYGHVGIVISSNQTRATVVDQNSINSNETVGHAAYLHEITWQGSYAPTYFIRFRNFFVPGVPNCGVAAPCDHSYVSHVEAAHPHRSYQECTVCGSRRYTGEGSYDAGCTLCNSNGTSARWTEWSAWSSGAPAQAPGREVEKRETVTGYNLVVYVTQEASSPYYRNLRNFSVNGNYGAYGLRSSYGEFAYRRYASKAELEAAPVCGEGTYIPQDGAHVGGYYRGSGTAYYFPDGYYWYVESPVTVTEYRFRDISA